MISKSTDKIFNKDKICLLITKSKLYKENFIYKSIIIHKLSKDSYRDLELRVLGRRDFRRVCLTNRCHLQTYRTLQNLQSGNIKKLKIDRPCSCLPSGVPFEDYYICVQKYDWLLWVIGFIVKLLKSKLHIFQYSQHISFTSFNTVFPRIK